MGQVDTAVRHSAVDDVVAILTGVLVTSLGLFLIKSTEAVTGGTAGLALLLSYATGLPFGLTFVGVNAPFFALAIRKKGWNFSVRTAISIALLSVLSHLNPLAITDVELDPLYGSVCGNLLAGIGLLVLFRHKSSLGGFNILALIVQERLGWRAGYFQMALDVAIVVSALAVVSPINVALSAIGAIVVNVVLALNHRPGRYVGW
jgi:uncharacterized membrane-anchored protein YitT (DUF2179 family)